MYIIILFLILPFHYWREKNEFHKPVWLEDVRDGKRHQFFFLNENKGNTEKQMYVVFTSTNKRSFVVDNFTLV